MFASRTRLAARTINFLGPSDPCKSLKPFTGVLEVPVVNCNRRDLFSIGHDLTACWFEVDLISSDLEGYEAEEYAPARTR